ncbi:MAG: response regulator [Desulfobacteraceae bacterium]|jgi:PAS domain S-box-containing protein
MKRPPTFRRFLLVMVFLLEGLSLAVVIGFLFAMLDQSMQQEQIGRINAQQAELRLHLTNRLNYTHSRVEEIRFNNNIRIALFLGMHSKIAESINAFYPQSMGSTFYVRSPEGRYYPQPGDDHGFLNDTQLLALQPGGVTQKAVNQHTFVYFTPIIHQDRVEGHAVGVYDLSKDPHCLELLAAFSDLSLVYRQEEHLTDVFTHRPLYMTSHWITSELTRNQHQHASDGRYPQLMGMQEFPSVYFIVDNQQYRHHRWSMVTKLVLLCIPLLILTFTISFLILKRVTCALDALAKNAHHIAATDGHSDLDTAEVRHAEFLYFAQAFNKVLSKVRRRTRDLKNANENLQEQIEERRQMADALQKSEAQLRSLQDNIPIGLFRRTIDGRFLFANPKMVSIFGYDSQDEMMNVPICRLYDHPEQYDYMMDWFKASDNIQRLELRFKRQDGTPIWGAVHLNRTVDQKTGTAYIDGALIDITDRKKIEDEKHKLETQLRQAHKMEALGTLAGGIAHDFNNILYAIIGYCELALEDAITDTSQQDNLQQAIAGAQRAAELVRQILTFARQTEIKKHPLNLTNIVKESRNLMRATLPTNIEIRTELDANPTVLADPTQVHQIIVNLCTNASHAMRDSGGVLTIALSMIDITPGNAPCETSLKEGHYALLKVADSGHGMSAETLERIFDPYFTTKAQGEGSGMGLSVVQGIVRSLNGAVCVDSVVGQGSTFNIYLPAVKIKNLQVQQQPNAIVGGGEHILFVDDESLLTRMISQLLSKMGYHVTTNNNPVAALEQFRNAPEQFDLVISDVTMPQMAGPDMAKEMMKIRPDLPVLLCTGYSANISEQMASNIGARALMYKPLVRDKLSAAIRGALDKRSAA